MRNKGRFLWAVFCLTPGCGGREVVLNKTYFLAIMFISVYIWKNIHIKPTFKVNKYGEIISNQSLARF